jgi:hypothetical protein
VGVLVAESLAGGGWSSGGALLMWAGVAVVGLFTVWQWPATRTQLAPFRSTGTTVVVVTLAVFAVVSAVFLGGGCQGQAVSSWRAANSSALSSSWRWRSGFRR